MNELHEHYLLKYSNTRNRLSHQNCLDHHLEVEDQTVHIVSEFPEHLPDRK